MNTSCVQKSIALIVLGALVACSSGSGGNSSGPAQILPAHRAMPAQSALSKIVGVGDSLTAGYQSDGFLGETGVRNPFYTGYFRQIPPNQENGWWALLEEQASGLSLEDAIAQVYDPSTSPLPLIRGPGLDNQIIPTNNIYDPIGQFKGTDPCTFDGSFNQAGFGLRTSARVRLNPNASTIRDFGIPGITLHEANAIHQPPTDTCSPLPGIPGLLNDVVSEESGTFWPVLRNFAYLGGNLTEVTAAASVHPTLATVWLGANDVLKYMGSGGRFVGGDRTPGQVETDLRSTVSTLEQAGAHVVLANLPNVLYAGYFQRVTVPKSPKDCALASYATCVLKLASIEGFVPQIAHEYGLGTPNGCIPTSLTKPCGYLTLPALFLIIQYYDAYGQLPNLDCAQPAPNCKAVPGSGLGANYITPQFAAEVQALNNAVNQGIDNTATAMSLPLVDVYTIFNGLASADPSNPYFRLAASIQPGVCCYIGYLAGIFSFDGIHPSNTGYGLVAYEFIATINKAYGTHIPQVDYVAAYNGTRCNVQRYCFPDPYAPHP